MSHTPGPWQVEGKDLITGGTDFELEIAYTIAVDPDDSQDCFHIGPVTKANTNLIAAAPELLEALENALGVIQATQYLQTSQIILPMIEAAIKKAKG